ncbi:MAG: PAS domain S-box protein [Leptolyngbyaceae cyanobacterium SM1_1_3]|nr:PAS domain S-box protein [Leptolyngbyaceae cyanobacterium SM1_1_3]
MTSLPRILTVVSHLPDASFLNQVLSHAGYPVDTVQTARSALQQLQSPPPQLILVGSQLDDGEGYQLCQQIKAAPERADTPVLFVDTPAGDLDRPRVFAVGGCDYLAQPLLAAEILAKMQTHLQRQQQQQLSEQQERWQLLLAGLGAGVFEWNPLTNSHSLSARTKTMLGYQPAELGGDYETWCQLLHPADRDRTLNVLKAYLDRQIPQYDLKYRLRCKNGRYRWIRARGQAKWNAVGQPLLMVGSHEDIHERQQAVEKLHRREQEFRALVENSPDIVSRFDRQYRYLYVNPPIQAVTGMVPQNFIGKTNRELGFAEDIVERWETTLEQVFLTRQEQFLSFVYPGKPDSSYWYARLVPELINGQVVSVLVVNRNVTPLQQAEDSLRHSEARFRALFEQATVGINQADLESKRFIRANQSFCELIGYSEAELCQLTYEDVSDTEDMAANAIDIRRLYREELPSITFEKRYRHKDGRLIWTSVTLSLIRNEAGQAFADLAIVQDISDRKQAEAALQTSEATNRAILQTIPDLLIYTDAEGKYLDHIPGQKVAPWGGALSQDPRSNVHQVLPPDLSKQRMQAIHQATNTGQMQVYEQQLKVEGQIENEEIRVVSLESNRVLVMVRNITHQKQTEAELSQREALLASLNNALPVGLLVINSDTNEILAVNHQFFKVWQIESLEADVQIGRLSYKELLLRCLESTDLEKPLAIAAPHPTSKIIEDELSLTDGRILRRIHGRVRSDSTYYGYFYLFEDITLRKQTERDLRQGLEREQSMTRLIQHMRRTLDLGQIFATTVEELRQVLHCDRVVIYRLDPEGSGRFVAESSQPGLIPVLPEMFSGDENLRSLFSADAVTVVHSQQTAAGAQSLAAQPENDRPEQVCGYGANVAQAQLPASQPKFLQQIQAQAYISSPIWQGQQLWGQLMIYQNRHPRQWQPSDMNVVAQISNQLGVAVQQAELLAQVQQQAIQLKQTAEFANQANRAKSLFLANMSHELRTPLNVILGLTQVIKRDRHLPNPLREQVDIINRSGGHLLELINSVLELSKIEAGHVSLREKSCDLAVLIQEVRAMLNRQAEAKELTFNTSLAAHVRYIKADVHKLRQILLNLVSNAIKFTPQGSVSLSVSALSQPESPPPAASQSPDAKIHLCFEVTDTGIGIATEDLESIFTAFEQVSLGQDFTNGSGLGLAISRHFAEIMGGNLTVESTLGRGSCFRLYLPAQVETAAAQAAQPTGVGLELGQPESQILIVDDHASSLLENRF